MGHICRLGRALRHGKENMITTIGVMETIDTAVRFLPAFTLACKVTILIKNTVPQSSEEKMIAKGFAQSNVSMANPRCFSGRCKNKFIIVSPRKNKNPKYNRIIIK